MKRTDLNRRDFNKLAAAAFGGVVTGTAIGCSKSKSPDKTVDDKSKKAAEKKIGDLADVANTWTGEKHVCKGLNACKDQGKSKKNECAGQGSCATVPKSGCHGENECKYLGGCDKSVGQNTCAKKGECKIPLKPDTWKTARKSFEETWTKADKKFGKPPADTKPTKKG